MQRRLWLHRPRYFPLFYLFKFDKTMRPICGTALAALFGAGISSALPSSRHSSHDDSVSAALKALGRHTLREPGSRPFPDLPIGTDTLPGIEHFVLLMLENHSFDNMIGMLGRGDGFVTDKHGIPLATNPYPNGSIQHAFKMPTTCQLSGTPSNAWSASHNGYNNGNMNGFVNTTIYNGTTEIVGGVAMGYFTEDQLPFRYSLLGEFPIGDRWFSSLLGQTYPNRRYLLAGTSAGQIDDTGSAASFAVATTPNGTIFNTLTRYNISWTNYVADFPSGATPLLYGGDTLTIEEANWQPFSQFYNDAAAGNLSSFTFLDPNYAI